MAVLLFLFAALTWSACSKEYSLEKNNGSIIGDHFPGGDSTGNGGGGDTSGNGDNDDPPPPPPPPGGGDTTTSADVDFMKKATYINRAQINNANLAVDRGTVQAVRDFGSALKTRFSQAQDDIETLGVQLKVTIPGQTDAAHQAVTTSFLDMEGRTFDIGYVEYQMLELQRAIDLYRAQIANGSDARVKAYAEKYLPYLEQFLQTASTIRQSL
jgi:putative membrane protein